MKKITSFIIVILFFQVLAMAQDNTANSIPQEEKTFETRIADILTEMPADNSAICDQQMARLVALGEKGLLDLTARLRPLGTGEDTNVRFALGSLSKYVTRDGADEERLMVSQGYSKALEQTDDVEFKTFMIKQLQMVGRDEVIDILKPYLSNDELCKPATQALNTIGSPNAAKALQRALKGNSIDNQSTIVKALADLKFIAAEKEISKLVNTDNLELRKACLHALATFGSKRSENVLDQAAATVHYGFDPTNATASYLLYAEKCAVDGNTDGAKHLCEKLMQNGPVNVQTQALSILVQHQIGDPLTLIQGAVKSDNLQYREAALKLAEKLQGEEITNSWLKTLDQYPPVQQAEIIEMMGRRADQRSLQPLLKFLDHNEVPVKIAAMNAVMKINPDESLDPLLTCYDTQNQEVIDALTQIMMQQDPKRALPKIGQLLPASNDMAKIAMMEVLSARKAGGYKEVVFKETENPNRAVRIAAWNGLASLAGISDVNRLFTQLESTDNNEEIHAIQNALLSIAKQFNTRDNRKQFIEAAQALSTDKKKYFIEILPELGGKESFASIMDYFNSDKEDLRKAAFKALCEWKGVASIYQLFDIISSEKYSDLKNEAITAYLNQVSDLNIPDEEQLLLIRKIYADLPTIEFQKTALEKIGKLKTFQAFLFASQMLDNPELQQTAAHAVMNIALPSSGDDEGLDGELVRSALHKVIRVISGPESDYDKENIRKYLDKMSEEVGFVSLFNGKDLSGWKGLVGNPITRASMDPSTLAEEQKKADDQMRKNWSVHEGAMWFDGEGANLCTDKKYGDFELLVDWRITKNGDSGIYLRGTPQVQIWDTSRVEVGAQVGSGGLYNNSKHRSTPLKVADNPVGDWNTFRIIMQGEKVTVYLNGELVVDHEVLENYWDHSQPVFPVEQIELQAHGTNLGFRDIYIKELQTEDHNMLTDQEKQDGFRQLFNGKDLNSWTGNKTDYKVEDGEIVIQTGEGGHGNLYTEDEYANFIMRFEFQLTPGANNGLGVRAPLSGDAAYVGMELQILDNTAAIYANLQPYQYHGSVYGVIPAKRGYLNPVGEWNSEEVVLNGPNVKVILNGHVIVDGNIDEASKNGTMDHKEHPGLMRKTGHIGFLGHGSAVKFRNLRIKELP